MPTAIPTPRVASPLSKLLRPNTVCGLRDSFDLLSRWHIAIGAGHAFAVHET